MLRLLWDLVNWQSIENWKLRSPPNVVCLPETKVWWLNWSCERVVQRTCLVQNADWLTYLELFSRCSRNVCCEGEHLADAMPTKVSGGDVAVAVRLLTLLLYILHTIIPGKDEIVSCTVKTTFYLTDWFPEAWPTETGGVWLTTCCVRAIQPGVERLSKPGC